MAWSAEDIKAMRERNKKDNKELWTADDVKRSKQPKQDNTQVPIGMANGSIGKQPTLKASLGAKIEAPSQSQIFNNPIPVATPTAPKDYSGTMIDSSKLQPIQYGTALSGNNVGGKQLTQMVKDLPLTIPLGLADAGKSIINTVRNTTQNELNRGLIPSNLYQAATNLPFLQPMRQVGKLTDALLPNKKEGKELLGKVIDKGLGQKVQSIEDWQKPIEEKVTSNPLSDATRALPTMGLALAGSFINPALGAGILTGTSYGSYAREAELEGADFNQQSNYATLGAGLEVGTEMPIFSGMTKFIKNGVAKETAEGLLKGIVKNSLKEGAQEAITEVGTTTAKKAIYAPDTEYSLKQIANAGLSGAIMSVMLLGLGSSVQATQNKVKQMAQAKDFSPKSVAEVATALEQEYQQPINEIIDIPKANSSELPNTSTGKNNLQVGDANKTIQPTPIQTAKQAIEPILQPNSVAIATIPSQNAFKADLSQPSLNMMNNTTNQNKGLQSNVANENTGSNDIKANINSLYTKYTVDQTTKTRIDYIVDNIMTVDDIDSAIQEIEKIERGSQLLPMNLQFFAEVKKELQAESKRMAKDILGLESITDEDIKALKDPSGFYLQSTDVFRNFKKAFGKNYELIKSKVLDPFDNAKLEKANFEKQITQKLDNDIVSKFGFKKGSKESAAIQKYGEGRMTEQQLREQFPKSWQNIVKADKWFREQYDQLIDEINESRQAIYPKVQENIKKVNGRIRDLKELIKRQEKAYQEKLGIANKRVESAKAKLDISKPGTIKNANLQLSLGNAEASLTRQSQQDLLNSIQRNKDRVKELSEMVNSESMWRGKIVPKRKDYYRHFQELSGLTGLKNIFATPSQIDPKLAGISEFTQPKSKFLGLAQRRGDGAFKDDAVGGFLEYIQAASYAKYIDPQIEKFRLLQRYLEDTTTDTRNMNNMIGYLKDYADDLAGKTNPADRYIQKVIPGGRTTIKLIDWLNSRVKANVILGNVSSSLSQIANIPQGIATVKNPVHLSKGFGNMATSFFNKGHNKLYDQSSFLSERYADKVYRKFDEKILDQPKKFAGFMLEALDEVGTKFIWSSVYLQAKEQGNPNPIKFADETTRSLVAGRGVGEVPLIQKSKIFQSIAPFTIEVNNLWKVQKDFVNKKDFGGLMMLYIANFLLNKGMEEIRGSGVVFDPIDAILDAFEGITDTEDDDKIDEKINAKQAEYNKLRNKNSKEAEKLLADIKELEDSKSKTSSKVIGGLGRIGGEVISNMPLGSTLASLYPEYGIKTGMSVNSEGEVKTTRLPSREAIFGDADPTRFGSGLLASKAIDNPLPMLALPFGGNQVKKTYKGLRDLGIVPTFAINKDEKKVETLTQPFPANYSYTSDGKKLNTPINPTPLTTGKALLFGNSAIPEVRDFYEDGKSLTPKQTKIFEKLVIDEGYDIMDLHEAFVEMKAVTKKADKRQILIDNGYSSDDADKIIEKLYAKE